MSFPQKSKTVHLHK